ncbi:MAG: hypothetical protein ACREFY_06540 [Acetobacteraceae bacterium]
MGETSASDAKAAWLQRVLGVTLMPAALVGDSGMAGFTARLAKLMPRIQGALAARQPDAQDMRVSASEAGYFARKQEFTRAHALLDALEKQLAALPPVTGPSRETAPSVTTGGPSTDAAPSITTDDPSREEVIPTARRPADALAEWQAARATAMTSLRTLEAAVRQMDVPERDRAVILLRAIQANLTEAPATPRQVAELQRYIETDDIIAEAEDPNGFGITVALRRPLLAALAGLADAHAAGRAGAGAQ